MLDEFLNALAQANEEFVALQRWADRQPGVSRVVSQVEARQFRSGSHIEGLVEAELAVGNRICWQLVIRQLTDGWAIEPDIFLQNGDHRDSVVEFQAVTVREEAECVSQLKNAVKSVVGNAESSLRLAVDFASQ